MSDATKAADVPQVIKLNFNSFDVDAKPEPKHTAFIEVELDGTIYHIEFGPGRGGDRRGIHIVSTGLVEVDSRLANAVFVYPALPVEQG